ncbi:GmrSD restriction endonuclease domain-containing protein [Cognatiluteimonas lumbrici]|uniref:GmrSD restriction endonuclease domain-containing protein n=1 Tax=Cognatiluteimonas lumbrici TaxID=2559601 RepID=UPI001C6FE5BE|nr:DUF262 domain-containing protein [Luteimonas lumbrici]
MIKRADFAAQDSTEATYETINTIGLRDLTSDAMIAAALRKPDFQRETNHWSPEQVVSLLECFVNGDLIPSVILWKSSSHLFVIDGGHRLSVLKAWVEDDYGDGPTSLNFFGAEAISAEQRSAAEQVRKRIAKSVGSWQHVQAQMKSKDTSQDELRKLQVISSRALTIQWVPGNAEKAEASFFKINTKGTPLDNIEHLLLSNRKKPIAIAARAVIRAGMGHKYWSSFGDSNKQRIESMASALHKTLFEPEVSTPIKTLDLPLGGSRGVRTALEVLIEFVLYAIQDQQQQPSKVGDQEDDVTGDATVRALEQALRLAKRVTGNSGGSLGLLPAIYFYGPSGRHASSMFLGTCKLIGRKLANNDKQFFVSFTAAREKLESILITHKELIASILQKTISNRRVDRYADLLDRTIKRLCRGETITEQTLVGDAGLIGKIVLGKEAEGPKNFSADTKSAVFLRTALASAIKCPICNGYLDPSKSVSYDHITDKKHGGAGDEHNCQMTHPYCNQSYKELAKNGEPIAQTPS